MINLLKIYFSLIIYGLCCPSDYDGIGRTKSLQIVSVFISFFSSIKEINNYNMFAELNLNYQILGTIIQQKC